jgi:hypothetical protein
MIPQYLFCLFLCTAAPPAGFSIYMQKSQGNFMQGKFITIDGVEGAGKSTSFRVK